MHDRGAAEKEIKGLVELVNRTWARRAEIQPDTTSRQRPTPMGVYQLLPKTNCKQCSEPTCWTFALKLVAGQRKLADCPPLTEPRLASHLSRLQALLRDFPAIR